MMPSNEATQTPARPATNTGLGHGPTAAPPTATAPAAPATSTTYHQATVGSP